MFKKNFYLKTTNLPIGNKTKHKIFYLGLWCVNLNNQNLLSEPFFIQDILLSNINNLEFAENIIIKPIYISNNIILN